MQIETDYFEARERFQEAAEAAGLRTSRVRVPFENQSELFIDFALVKRDPRRALVHLCGAHGVEGFLGSYVQRRLLAELPAEGPSLLFVHGLNPYGMAYHRRANGSNVDLNRSFHAGKVENPDYKYFDRFLNPRSGLEFYTGLLSAAFARFRIGETRMRQAIASGQMEFPHGLFFAGSGLQREVKLVHEFLRSHFSAVENYTVLDVHTGLGDWKGEMLFADEDREADSPAYFEKIFGRPVNRPDPREGAYSIHGRLSDAFRHALPRAHLRYCLQEFGTYPARRVINALRRENFEWRFRQPGTPPPEAIQLEMLECFLPADPSWREHCVGLGVQRWREAWTELAR